MNLATDAKPGLSIEALSRGQGVPRTTRQAYQQIKALLIEARNQGMSIDIREIRIGLEGETRLCIEFQNQRDAETMLAQIKPLAVDIELLNIAVKRCHD